MMALSCRFPQASSPVTCGCPSTSPDVSALVMYGPIAPVNPPPGFYPARRARNLTSASAFGTSDPSSMNSSCV